MILGVDPGQRRDPAGIVCLDGLAVVHIERVPLHTSYGALAGRVATIARMAGGAAVVVDATGARPFLDLLEAEGLAPVAVTLTGGGKVHVRGREVSLPRASLFTPVVAAVEAGRLRVAEGCPYAGELAQELLQARGGPSGAESRGKGHHGDLMTAVALAVWGAGLAGAGNDRC